MNPYLSWTIVLAVAGGLGWYYTNGSKPKGRTAVKAPVEKTEVAQSIPKQKKKPRKGPESVPAPARKLEEEPQLHTAPIDTADEEEDVSNKEFAKRFAAVKNGVTASEPSKPRSKERRAKKATAVNPLEGGSSELSGSHLSTGTSSTTGADADDDLSSTGSPVVNATVPAADFISDMLEAPAPGASVLRLTGSLEGDNKKKQKGQAFKQVETKKQRQQRQKNEARKQQMQEAEAERRQLLEKQLRTAREAERREAATRQPAAPAPNAWKRSQSIDKSVNNAANDVPQVTVTNNASLLDTFEPENVPTTRPANSSTGTWAQDLPPEDEQMRMLGVAQDDDWTTVSTKKTKKKGPKADESVSDASASEIPVPASAPAPTEWVAPKVSQIPIPVSRGKGHPLDSDWVA